MTHATWILYIDIISLHFQQIYQPPSLHACPCVQPVHVTEQTGWRLMSNRSKGIGTSTRLTVVVDGQGRCPPVQLLQSGCSSLAFQEAYQMEKPSLQAVLPRKLKAVTLSLFLHIPCCFQISFYAYI